MEVLAWLTRNAMYIMVLTLASVLAAIVVSYTLYNPLGGRVQLEFPLEDVYPLTAYAAESGRKVVYVAEIYLPLKPGKYIEHVAVNGLDTCEYIIELYDSSGARYKGKLLRLDYKAAIPMLYQRIMVIVKSCSAPVPQASLKLVVERR